jgi:predicted SAM-dependent methyltransferase
MSCALTIEEFNDLRVTSKRLAWLLHDVALEKANGLEIGALNNPTPLPSSMNIEYVDYAPTEVLRQYPHLNESERKNVVHVSHVWAGTGSLQDICKKNDYDFIIACQVIEHIPNVLGWLQGLFDVLRPGGVLNLAIPDRRFTFDILRKPSTLGEMVEAYLLQYKKPSIRQVFDHTYHALDVKIGEPWEESFAISEKQKLCGANALQFAFDQCNRSLVEGQYYDSHCWIFTPLSFLDCVEGAMALGLFPFVVSGVAPTQTGEWEFYVSLRKDTAYSGSQLRDYQIATLRYLREKVKSEYAATNPKLIDC